MTTHAPGQKRLKQLEHANTELRLALESAKNREHALRREIARLNLRLTDLGEPRSRPARAGYQAVDAAAKSRLLALRDTGLNYSAISRRTGFSVATVSLVCRGKYHHLSHAERGRAGTGARPAPI